MLRSVYNSLTFWMLVLSSLCFLTWNVSAQDGDPQDNQTQIELEDSDYSYDLSIISSRFGFLNDVQLFKVIGIISSDAKNYERPVPIKNAGDTPGTILVTDPLVRVKHENSATRLKFENFDFSDFGVALAPGDNQDLVIKLKPETVVNLPAGAYKGYFRFDINTENSIDTLQVPVDIRVKLAVIWPILGVLAGAIARSLIPRVISMITGISARSDYEQMRDRLDDNKSIGRRWLLSQLEEGFNEYKQSHKKDTRKEEFDKLLVKLDSWIVIADKEMELGLSGLIDQKKPGERKPFRQRLQNIYATNFDKEDVDSAKDTALTELEKIHQELMIPSTQRHLAKESKVKGFVFEKPLKSFMSWWGFTRWGGATLLLIQVLTWFIVTGLLIIWGLNQNYAANPTWGANFFADLSAAFTLAFTSEYIGLNASELVKKWRAIVAAQD